MLVNPRLCAAFGAALLSVSLLGCQGRHAPGRVAFRGFGGPVEETADTGEQLLTVAFVQNALQAMALGGQVAALNNLNQAIGHSQPLQDQGWVASGPRRGRAAAPAMDPNAVSTRLISAKAKLLTGDDKTAAAELQPVAESVPPGVTPARLMLLRASASLGLAQAASDAGRLAEMRVELRAAASQLETAAANGADQPAPVRALARSIDGRLDDRSSLDLGQFAAWKQQVDQWLGGPTSGATLIIAMQSTPEA